MKIDERKALNTQKPQSEKVYETKSEVSARTAKTSSPAQQDGVALEGQDQLRTLAMTPSAEDTSRVAALTKLVQSPASHQYGGSCGTERRHGRSHAQRLLSTDWT